MAGTWALNLFDRLHMGHHILLDRLSDMPNPVAALTNDSLISKDLEIAQVIQPIEIRKAVLEDYLKTNDLARIIEIAVLSAPEDLLEIPGETTFLMFDGPCCAEIEEHVLELRMKKLGIKDTFERIKPVRALDGDKMSSARIRMGDIDRKGRPLAGTNEHPRRLPDENRGLLKNPKGVVYSTGEGRPEVAVIKRLHEENPPCVIAVGDVTSATLIAEGYTPDVCVIDGITKRGRFDEKPMAEIEYIVYNPAAMIYPEAWSTMDTAIHDNMKSLIVVEGEEDLIGFPAVLLAKDGSVMLYGQPDVGIVWVPVTEENKRISRELLENMPIIV